MGEMKTAFHGLQQASVYKTALFQCRLTVSFMLTRPRPVMSARHERQRGLRSTRKVIPDQCRSGSVRFSAPNSASW